VSGILTAAEIARMRGDMDSIIATLGTPCSVRRLVQDGNGQTALADPHQTDVPVFITPLSGVAEFMADTPAGVMYEGRTPVSTVVQETDIITDADGKTYQVQNIRTFLAQRLLTLSTWSDPLNA
jgi:hypothetical protein